MNYTTNLNLKKPEQTEYYNVDDFNDNADTLDTTIKTIQDDVNGLDTSLDTEVTNRQTADSTLQSSINTIANNLRGTADYVFTGNGPSTDASWKQPIGKAGTGVNSEVFNSSSNIASGSFSHAEGGMTTASGYCSHAEGSGNPTQQLTASGDYSHAEGYSTIASGNYSHAEGENTVADGVGSHAEGVVTTASGYCSHAGGIGVNAGGYQACFGLYNDNTSSGKQGLNNVGDTTGSVFIVGIGTGPTARTNALRISASGQCYGSTYFAASGADFAEQFEWADGNTNNEDRRGLFVTLEGEKIKLATTNDYILGAISATPTVIGDMHSENWKDMFKRDVFGERITETVEVAEITTENGEVIPAHTEIRFIINPNYNNEKEYISRDLRPEWAAVGMVGKLIVCDDGTCEVNGYCTVGTDSKATQSDNGYRVIARLDDSHIKIIIK